MANKVTELMDLREATSTTKYYELNKLNEGSKVLIKERGVEKPCVFMRMKKTKFDGVMDGKNYSIPYEMVVAIIEKAEPRKLNKGYMKLKEGELFYIKYSGNALIYIFSEVKNGKIIGINPVTMGKDSIAPDLYEGKVSEIKKKYEKSVEITA